MKIKSWIHICLELNKLGFLKSMTPINASSEWVKSISEQIQAIYSIFSFISPLSPLLHKGGPKDCPLQFFDRGSSGNASNELIFHDIVPFNNQQDLAKPFFRFFFKFLKNVASKAFGPLKFWREIWKNRKKSIFSKTNHTFSSWISILHVLSILLSYITFL